MPNEITPKATLTVREVGPGFTLGKSILGGVVSTFRVRRGRVNTSLAISDRTFTPIGTVVKGKDITGTLDVRMGKGVTANTKYEVGTKKYTGGATWDGRIGGKLAQVKAWYTNKDNLISGESTISFNPQHKLNLTFNQKKLLTSKYTVNRGSISMEPSFNLARRAPAIAFTKRLQKATTVKLAYDIKSEGVSLEYNRRPFKMTVASTAGKSLKFAKPTFTAVYENTYVF